MLPHQLLGVSEQDRNLFCLLSFHSPLRTMPFPFAGMVQRLTAENAVLRHQLLAVCAQNGAAMPAPMPLPPFPPGFAPLMPGMAFPGATPKARKFLVYYCAHVLHMLSTFARL